MTSGDAPSFWGLDCGGGLKELEAHLQSNAYVGGGEAPSADDLEVLKHVPDYDLLKYGFKRVHAWKAEVLDREASIDTSVQARVVIKRHSPQNEAYLRRKLEEQARHVPGPVIYELWGAPVLFPCGSDMLPPQLAIPTCCAAFEVEDAVFDVLPDLHIVTALLVDANNHDGSKRLRGFYDEVCRGAKDFVKQLRLTAAAEAAYLHPDLKLWRGYAGRLGVSNDAFPQSVQAMWKRISAGGSFHVNPLVDFYNALSIKHVVTGGGFDLGDMPGDIELRLSGESDTFLALDAVGPPLGVPPGEVSYVAKGAGAVSGNILTRHLAYKQSRLGLIRAETRHVFLTFEMPPDLVDRVAPALVAGLRALPGMYEEGVGMQVLVQVVNRRTPRARIPVCGPGPAA